MRQRGKDPKAKDAVDRRGERRLLASDYEGLACRRRAVNSRELWLNTLSDEELIALSPWDIITTDNARKFLLTSGRVVLRKFNRFGLTHMSDEEVLHEVYPMLVENMPGIIKTCVKKSQPDNRDGFIFGCLGRLIRYRITELVFGSNSPGERLYFEEIPPELGDDSPMTNSLMHPYAEELNAYIESQPAHNPQFLSESEFVPERKVQEKHSLIEQFRPFLTSREVDVLRSMLLNSEDRSLIALEIGTTPKQVSRYRQSIQRKMYKTLLSLGWNEEELTKLTGKRRPSSEATSVQTL
tara:strand:+ start:32128 stop:33015 length:888 start_codon:yes stop_codon:yes gene_type:complete